MIMRGTRKHEITSHGAKGYPLCADFARMDYVLLGSLQWSFV